MTTSTTRTTSRRRARKARKRDPQRRHAAFAGQRVGLVGVGKLGSFALDMLLWRGVHVLVLEHGARTRSAVRALAAERRKRRRRRWSTDALPAHEPQLVDAAALARTRVVYLCVPEDQVELVAAQLADAWRGGPRPRAVLHASGHLTTRALAPLRRLGIAVGALHPMQAFGARGRPLDWIAESSWSIAGMPAAQRAAEWLGRAFDEGGPPYSLWRAPDSARARALYHAACVLANNGGLALYSHATALLRRAGLTDEAAHFGVKHLMSTAFSSSGRLAGIDPPLERQLRGPLARGQIDVVREQLRALGPRTRVGLAYRALSLELLELARRGKRLSARQRREFERLLR